MAHSSPGRVAPSGAPGSDGSTAPSGARGPSDHSSLRGWKVDGTGSTRPAGGSFGIPSDGKPEGTCGKGSSQKVARRLPSGGRSEMGSGGTGSRTPHRPDPSGSAGGPHAKVPRGSSAAELVLGRVTQEKSHWGSAPRSWAGGRRPRGQQRSLRAERLIPPGWKRGLRATHPPRVGGLVLGRGISSCRAGPHLRVWSGTRNGRFALGRSGWPIGVESRLRAAQRSADCPPPSGGLVGPGTEAKEADSRLGLSKSPLEDGRYGPALLIGLTQGAPAEAGTPSRQPVRRKPARSNQRKQAQPKTDHQRLGVGGRRGTSLR